MCKTGSSNPYGLRVTGPLRLRAETPAATLTQRRAYRYHRDGPRDAAHDGSRITYRGDG